MRCILDIYVYDIDFFITKLILMYWVFCLSTYILYEK